MTVPNRKLQPEVTVDREALEIELEAVWCSLSSWPASLWLTPSGRILRAHESEPVLGAVEIGRYTKAVLLADFRGDVFHIFEAMTRRGHRART